jgi:Transposase DDE domain
MLCQLRMNGKDLRLAQRRADERTGTFRKDYRIRGGIEATNSMLKRVTGLGRLRVRGRPAVFASILLKVAGWNLLRAASVRSLIKKLKKPGQVGQAA